MKQNIRRLVESNIRIISRMNYFDFGNILNGKKIIGEFFMFDTLSEDNINILRDMFGSNIEVKKVSSIYAPEIIKVVLNIKY